MTLPFRVPPLGSRPFDVAGLGLNSVDLVAVVAEYPESNSKQRLRHFARLPGGQIATALTACARLGWRTTYIGSFGDDEFGQAARDSLTSEGVQIDRSQTVAGATNEFAIILVDQTSGDRTVLWDRHPGLTMTPEMVARDVVVSARMLLVDCYDTAAATQAARYAREASVATVIDVEQVRPGINDLLRNIDAIIAAESFPAELTGYEEQGRALEAMAREFAAPLVCVTLGADGSLARAGGQEIRTPAFAVDAVDTTGAGDAFRGGFVAACLRNPDGTVEETLAYANAVAALNCRALGARGGLPTAAEIAELMARGCRF